MSDLYPDGDATPTAAVGSTSPILKSTRPRPKKSVPETIFTVDEVMSLVTSITKQATTSAVSAALSTISIPTRDCGRFYLPPFDPDERSHDIRDWCANVDETIATLGISSHEARMKAILQLKGRAKTWADKWSLQSTTWNKIKEDLIQTFGEEFRYADDVQKWRDYTSDQASSYANYATTGWTLFKRVRPEATDKEVIDALITGICPTFIKCELLRNTPDSLTKLVAILKTYRKRDRPKNDGTEKNFNNKKPRLSEKPDSINETSITCYKCFTSGHRARDCTTDKPTQTKPVNLKSVECKYCFKRGHGENMCFRKQLDELKSSTQKSKP